MAPIKLIKKLYLLLIFTTLFTSCITKVIRPKLTGTIVDEMGMPVDSCQVGEAFTNKDGNFVLKEVTHKSLISLFGSSPVFISERINKEGYELKELMAAKQRGGISQGSVWNMDTIRLRKTLTDFSKINMKVTWLTSMTKNLDTVFMTKKNQEYDQSKIDFIANYQDTYARGYYFVGIDNLPANVFERHIELDLKTPVLKLQRVLIYGDPKTSEKTKYDTIYSKGKWKQDFNNLQFQTDLPELNGTYKVVDFNYDSMKLVKQ